MYIHVGMRFNISDANRGRKINGNRNQKGTELIMTKRKTSKRPNFCNRRFPGHLGVCRDTEYRQERGENRIRRNHRAF